MTALMNRFFVFLGLVALFILVANVELSPLLHGIDISTFMWIGGGILLYSMMKGGSCGKSKCAKE